jgi:hypothetical protein
VSKQPEALRLADAISPAGTHSLAWCGDASAELRRQHALIEELREALIQMVRWMPVYPSAADGLVGGKKAHADALKLARASLAKAEPK